MKEKSNLKRNVSALTGVILLCFIDQITKYFVSSRMLLGEVIPLIEGVFQLRYIRNDGMAWSLLEGKQIIFVILTPVVMFFLIKVFFC